VSAPTPEDLEATLADHPELLERLKRGDSSAFEEILEVVGRASVGEVTVRLVENRRGDVRR
jgi:hypothetical protein